MILDKYVEIPVQGNLLQYYVDLGYEVPKKYNPISYRTVYDRSKTFKVKVEDLPKGSKIKINVKCDICGKELYLGYRDYLKNISKHNYYACKDCTSVKRKDSFMERFGVDHPLKVDDVKEKVKNTCLERYGYENVNQVPEIRAKSEKTCLEKYGFPNIGLSPEIQSKAHETNFKKYGSFYVMGTDYFKQKSLDYFSALGVTHSSQLENVQEKKRKTFYKNGTCKTSKQQEYICNLYDGKLNAPFLKYNLDILLDENIVIEVDFSGHDLSVTLGYTSQDSFDKRELIREIQLRRNGYKVIHYISHTDKLPSDEILNQILKISKEYFSSTSHTWIKWYFDENKYENAEHKNGVLFNFGELHKLKQT